MVDIRGHVHMIDSAYVEGLHKVWLDREWSFMEGTWNMEMKAERDKDGHMIDKKEMKRVEEKREGFIRGQRSDYRCSQCKGKLDVVEFVYGNVTVVKIKPCIECDAISTMRAYGKGYDKGYVFGQEDK